VKWTNYDRTESTEARKEVFWFCSKISQTQMKVQRLYYDYQVFVGVGSIQKEMGGGMKLARLLLA
jgi:hypothetical protein